MQFRDLIFVAMIGWGASVAQCQPLRLIDVAAIPTVTYLGVEVQDVNAERAKDLKLPDEAGVEVTLLDPYNPSSPAAVAGIKVGDVVRQYNGQRVENREQFLRLLRDTAPGTGVRLQIYRNGAPQIVVARVVSHAAMNFQGQLVPIQPLALPLQGALQDVQVARMIWANGVLGAVLESLEGQLADFFGVKEGVLVRSVTRGSAAARAGLKAGDVITQVGDGKVSTAMEVSGRIRASRGQSAMLTVWRDRHEVTLLIALDGALNGSRQGEQ